MAKREKPFITFKGCVLELGLEPANPGEVEYWEELPLRTGACFVTAATMPIRVRTW